jgi:hypothetical protein
VYWNLDPGDNGGRDDPAWTTLNFGGLVSEDQVEIWNAMKDINREESQKRRANNRDSSAAILQEKGIPYETSNGGVHLVIRHKGRRADFWPGTGKWIVAGGKDFERVEARGVHSLIKFFERIKY